MLLSQVNHYGVVGVSETPVLVGLVVGCLENVATAGPVVPQPPSRSHHPALRWQKFSTSADLKGARAICVS